MKRKIIILAMSCKDSFFTNQINDIKETYAKNLPDNIRFIYYDGLWKNTKLKDDHLMCNTKDDLESTFTKTYEALKYLYINEDFDYIFRTNTSTYINVNLLNEFVQTLHDDSIVYGSDLYSLSDAACPNYLDIYARGNGILMSRKTVLDLLFEGIPFINTNIVDDVAIGNILNSYHIKRRENYLDYIKGLPHAWYKSTKNKIQSNHRFSTFGDDDIDYNRMITIQIKSYVNRDEESEHYKELHNKITKIPVDFDYINEYIKNPSIFIGSLIGYVDYNIWKSLDRNKLFAFEINHKASNDPSKDINYDINFDNN